MKTYIPYSLLLAAAATGMAFGANTAYTTPVGYVTTSLAPSKYSLVSLTVHNATVFGAKASGATANSVSFTGVDFTTILTAGSVYILELPNGVTQEVSAWTATSLTVAEDISGSITANETAVKLRKAATVSDVFGATNSVGLTSDGDEDLTNNDVLLVPNADNAFDTVYFFNDGETVGWFDDQGESADNKILNYGDGFFVQRIAGANSLNLTVVGEVKVAPTRGVTVPGYNYMGAVAPAGLTLSNSNLESSLTIATNEEEATSIADFVLKQNADGTYRTAYYFNDGETTGWFDDQGESADDLVLDGGYLIQNKGAAKPVTIAVPNSYTAQ